MNNSIKKNTKHFHKAKYALSKLQKYSESCNDIVELAELLNPLINAIHEQANVNKDHEYKAVHALSRLNDLLDKREVKVKYSIKARSEWSIKNRNKLILQMHQSGDSLMQIVNNISLHGYSLSKSGVNNVIQNSKGGES